MFLSYWLLTALLICIMTHAELPGRMTVRSVDELVLSSAVDEQSDADCSNDTDAQSVLEKMSVYERFARGFLLEDRIFQCLEYFPQLLGSLLIFVSSVNSRGSESSRHQQREKQKAAKSNKVKFKAVHQQAKSTAARNRDYINTVDDSTAAAQQANQVIDLSQQSAAVRRLIRFGLTAADYRCITRLSGIFVCFSARTLNIVFHRDFGVWSWYRDALEVLAWLCDILFAFFKALMLGGLYRLLPYHFVRFDDHATYFWFYSIVFRLINNIHNVVLVAVGHELVGAVPFAFAHKNETLVAQVVIINFVWLLAKLGIAISYARAEGPQTLLPSVTGDKTAFFWWKDEAKRIRIQQLRERAEKKREADRETAAASQHRSDANNKEHPGLRVQENKLKHMITKHSKQVRILSSSGSGSKCSPSMGDVVSKRRVVATKLKSIAEKKNSMKIWNAKFIKYLWFIHRFLIATNPRPAVLIGSNFFYFIKGACGSVAAIISIWFL